MEVLIAGARPAAPALGAGDEAGVQDEQEEGEPVGEPGGERGADEIEVEGVDEEVVECYV